MPNHYTTIAICSPGHEFDVDDFNERHAETNLCQVVMPMPEPIEQTPSAFYPDGTTEAQRRGLDTDWYEWANKNWGTKWGTYHAKAFELGGDGSPILIKFQSAWSAPSILDKIADLLKKTYEFEKVVWFGFDPYDSSVEILSKEPTP